MDFKLGDPVIDTSAGDRNPRKSAYFVKTDGKHAIVADVSGVDQWRVAMVNLKPRSGIRQGYTNNVH